ncbi:MAG: hypothetical protein AAF629_32335 [Chloroflexota bacterium]
MDDLNPRQKKALFVGLVLGALIGAGITWLMILAPSDDVEDEEPQAISAGDILSLTGALASLVRMIDSFRRRL